ncbi:Do family serine endopeptidase [Silanimonas lenta]|uniref:Do family serine endopeptidase n=1 Tax=Silanimonas lenta TaxID=265429 RepID=UPI0003FA398A|nr:Do family serine endopeptidase [Silanimonas lenta]
MRPLPLFACLLAAALLGGLVARGADDATPVPAARAAAEPAAPAPLPPVPAGGEPARTVAALPALPSLAPMLENVTPAVVNIYTRQVVEVQSPLAADPFFRRFFGLPDMPLRRESQSLGSGVIVDAERGYVLTNHHVVENATEVSVQLQDGRTLEAEFIGSDPGTDVALIRIPAGNLRALPLADSQSLRVGDFVVAVGNPFGLGQTVTSGIVSAVGRSGLTGLGFQDFIQTDASINPGNSGGALVNLRGELVGINTASFNPRGSAAGNIGLGFAIPSNLAREVMRQLLVYGEVKRGSLGVELTDLTPRFARELGLEPTLRGAIVTRVYRNAPGEAAGLRPGDVVTAINRQRVDGAQALRNAEGLLPVNRPVTLEVRRGAQTLSLSATLREQPRQLPGADIDPRLEGALLGEVAERFRNAGLLGVAVAEVDPRSRAALNGLRPGDRIYGVNGRRVDDLAALRSALAQPPGRLVLRVQRGAQQGDLELR